MSASRAQLHARRTAPPSTCATSQPWPSKLLQRPSYRTHTLLTARTPFLPHAPPPTPPHPTPPPPPPPPAPGRPLPHARRYMVGRKEHHDAGPFREQFNEHGERVYTANSGQWAVGHQRAADEKNEQLLGVDMAWDKALLGKVGRQTMYPVYVKDVQCPVSAPRSNPASPTPTCSPIHTTTPTCSPTTPTCSPTHHRGCLLLLSYPSIGTSEAGLTRAVRRG